MSRIQLTDNAHGAITKMVEGNPGALSVCVKLIKNTEQIDPQSFLGGFGKIMILDTFKIYGSRIWMLYKHVCNQDIVKTIGLLRACQLGFLPESALHLAIDNYGKGIDIDSLMNQVQECLPDFNQKGE